MMCPIDVVDNISILKSFKRIIVRVEWIERRVCVLAFISVVVMEEVSN